MQDYREFAAKNEVVLLDEGHCQFCGAQTQRGIHQCLEVFNLGFQGLDFSNPAHHFYRFQIVDAHALQHPEIHGRWSNHFHLTRLYLIFHFQVNWNYGMSSQLSDHLNQFKARNADQFLAPPPCLHRGTLTSTDVLAVSDQAEACKELIKQWAQSVFDAWYENHATVHPIAQAFLGH